MLRERYLCEPSLPAAGAAAQRERKALRASGALSLLRGSCRAAAMCMKKPLVLQAGCTYCSRCRFSK